MSLETVEEGIRSRTKKRVQGLKAEAKAEAERILGEAKAKRKGMMEEALAEAAKAVERLKAQEVSRVELENKRGRLMMEKELLDLVLERTRARVRDLPDLKDRELMRRLITSHGPKGKVIYSAKRHETMVKAAAPSLRYGGNIDCLGGIVIESSDGSVRHDYRYDTILGSAADATMKDVARILFE